LTEFVNKAGERERERKKEKREERRIGNVPTT
jgi:hypothetical protein